MPFAAAADRRSRRSALSDILILALLVTAAWCYHYQRLGWESLQTPIAYDGDATMVFARIKAYADGELRPFASNLVASLNAPFAANWNDFPQEDLIYLPAALLAAGLGLAAGVNLYLLLLHLAAGLAFYGTGRLLGVRRDYALAGALLFALAPYAFARGVGHLTLTTYWHIPPLLAVILWLGWPQRVAPAGGRALAGALAVAFVTGALNPYYLLLFLALLAFVAGGLLLNREFRRLALAGLLLTAAAAGFVASHLDTLLYALAHGGNPAAVTRNLGDLAVYGLRLPDLLFPAGHRSEAIAGFFQRLYHHRTPAFFNGEASAVYLGAVAAAGLLGLLLIGTLRLSARQFERVPVWYWLAALVLALALAGGLNYLLGALGVVTFRATNRYTIVLACLALLWLGEALPHTRPGRLPWLLPLLLIAIGLFDQVPPPAPGGERSAARWQAEGQLVRGLEAQLPPGAMVFQLPVKPFPESGPIHRMADYDHLRPWLHAQQLRFSYGTTKGRDEEEWQQAVAALPPAEMARRLAAYGFAAILINRDAYPDGGAALEGALQAAGAVPVASGETLLALRLSPAASPEPLLLPALRVRYPSGFLPADGDHQHPGRWAGAEATLRLEPQPHLPAGYLRPAERPLPERHRLSFKVESVAARNLWIEINGARAQLLSAAEPQRLAREVGLQVPLGVTELKLIAEPIAARGEGPGGPLVRVSEVTIGEQP